MPARIGPLWALLIGFVVLMASNSWLKGIFGVGEIATDVPFLLTGLTLFVIWKFNRRGGGRNSTLLGSARFGDRHDLAKLEGSGDLVIGRSGRNNRLLRYDGPAHLLTMAPTRSGKGVGTIIPNLLLLGDLHRPQGRECPRHGPHTRQEGRCVVPGPVRRLRASSGPLQPPGMA